VITLDNEEKSGRSYLKYAAIFVLGLGLTASVSYCLSKTSYRNCIETAVQKQVNNKIQSYLFIKVQFLR
jgi:hypothetical protein